MKNFSENTEKQFPISSETSRNVIFREFQCFVDYLQSAEDMPYKKELIQAKILRSFLGQEIILLPRFMTNTLNLILGSQLKNGSIGDAVVFLPNAEKYIEFKVCKEAYIGEQINKSMPLIDCIFVILSDVEFFDSKQYRHYLEKRSRKWNIKDSLKIIVCDMQGKYAMKLEKLQ